MSEDDKVDTQLTFDQAEDLFVKGLMGTIEFRNWLARAYSDFAAIRDSEVDDSIRTIAESRQKKMEAEILLGG